jgi:DNA-binding NarL/FixJ family response regulator
MRVVIVGPGSARDRIRPMLSGIAVIVAEVLTMEEGRSLGADIDAYVVAPGVPTGAEATRLVEQLTSRELEVLALLAEGLPNRLIAARLAISAETVKFHVASICGKLGARNRTDAVRRAVRKGLITI